MIKFFYKYETVTFLGRQQFVSNNINIDNQLIHNYSNIQQIKSIQNLKIINCL